MSRQGVNLPGVLISAPSLTEKDRSDLECGVAAAVDYVALSFVRSAADVLALRSLLAERMSAAGIVAKIEKREALDDFEAIVVASDAVMVARGDLGVEIPPEDVPVAQKRIIERCRARGKPVIIATQMLESMVRSSRPTRAEASDVANAVLDGADAVMLSAETASGVNAVESVRVMDRIARRAEAYAREPGAAHGALRDGAPGQGAQAGAVEDPVRAVCAGAVEIAERVNASVLACLTHSGETARILASHRPGALILALTDHPPVVRRLALLWGTRAAQAPPFHQIEKIFDAAREWVRSERFTGTLVLTAGIPTHENAPTNAVHVVPI